MVINFQFDTKYGAFKDAIHLPENHTYTNDDIEAMKQTRLDNWIAIVTAPQPEYKIDENGNLILDENGIPIEVVEVIE
jgi:hypothetical protein